ncbi:protein : Protein HflC OS=Bradyrhizobium sp. STM 3843 GN=hflC PE=3 SV=1: Band_7 [Gemmataceae bacterium]|nr:protein : Protein HflC OS=Bradyrhizobium sp. STM 3843 GN=hflC PE=3 SV=1: Band_7 [Gemmataceae bacterium]VTU02268.1 protein : Protein HflC OS=Bradyrhizobium sp. STM 3843 GN=hflC PE=3 SV=1: Band_7 [Gemmataceae bacterium]
MTRYTLIPAALLLALWGRTALYAVDQAEFVYVTRFGEPVVVHDGATDAGLHAKLPWPIDAVQRIDRRIQSVDLPAVEVLTRDRARDAAPQTVGSTLTVDATIVWKVPTPAAADQFFRTVRTPEQAKKILGPLVNGRLSAVVSTVPIETLIDVVDVQAAAAGVVGVAAVLPAEAAFRAADASVIDARAERVRERLLGDGLRERALAEYGIEVVDVRVRRFSYPEAVRAKIAERIRSERDKKAADYESEGRKRAADITTDADRAARTVEADARAKKTVIEGQANAEAKRILAQAWAQDREFYLFLQNLRAFQRMMENTRDVWLLSTKNPLLRPLAGPPGGMKDEKGKE